MLVKVRLDACSGDCADVQPDVEALAAERPAQRIREHWQKRTHLGERGGGELGGIRGVLVRHQHNVAGVVGIEIQDDEGVIVPVQDEGFDVARLLQPVAEDAAVFLRLSSDIAHAPGRPEALGWSCMRGLRHRGPFRSPPDVSAAAYSTLRSHASASDGLPAILNDMTANIPSSSMDAADIQPTQSPRVLPVTTPGIRDRASLQLALGFQLGSIVLDVASVLLAFWIAYYLRYQLQLGRPVVEA